ncbi:MAG: hypothetical protein RIT43_1945 [Bacteroidota bacterium]|jgi:hypothetical protein
MNRGLLKFFLIAISSSLIFGQSSFPNSRTYSPQEQNSFFKEVILPFLNGITTHTSPYPEINERSKVQQKIIQNRFGGKHLRIEPHTTYAPQSSLTFATSDVTTDGIPRISIAIPAFMDQYFWLKTTNKPRWQEAFEVFVVAGIMHELDHLTETPKVNAKTFNVEVEIHINALTTQYVTSVLVEKYHKQVYLSDEFQYRAWISANRNEKSPIWRKAIKDLYAPLMK